MVQENTLDEVGKLMLSSARVYAAAGCWIPVSYVERMLKKDRIYD